MRRLEGEVRLHSRTAHDAALKLEEVRPLLRRNVKRFREGLVFEAHRLFVSLNCRLESNKEEEEGVRPREGSALDFQHLVTFEIEGRLSISKRSDPICENVFFLVTKITTQMLYHY